MFITDNIDLEQADKYILILRISPDSFSFYIEDTLNASDYSYGEKKWDKEADILTEIQQIIFENNFLTLTFSKVNIIYVSKNYELIPNYLLEKDKIKTLYNFTHSTKSDCVLLSPLNIYNNNTIFNIDENVYKFLVRSLFNPIFFHHICPVLGYIKQNLAPIMNNDSIVLYLHDSFIDIFCYNKTHTLQFNKTLYQEKDIDSLYYILNFWNKFKLDQEKDFLYIIANSDNTKDLLINNIKKYIRNVEFIDYKSVFSSFISEYSATYPPFDLLTLKNIL